MQAFSKKLNGKINKVLALYPTKCSAAEALGVSPGSLGGWVNKRESGRLAAARLEVSCERVLAEAEESQDEEQVPEEVPEQIKLPTRVLSTTLPNLILRKRLDTLEAKIDALLGACGIDPDSLA
jgi:hypothetical protein